MQITLTDADHAGLYQPTDWTPDAADELDPPLTYQITNGSPAFSDTFSGALARDPDEGCQRPGKISWSLSGLLANLGLATGMYRAQAFYAQLASGGINVNCLAFGWDFQ